MTTIPANNKEMNTANYMMNQCLFNVGPSSVTLAQHQVNIGSICRLSREPYLIYVSCYKYIVYPQQAQDIDPMLF